MKELFENWRKYTKNLLKENDEKVKAAQEKVSITKNYAQQLVNSATAELNAAKEEAAQQKAAEQAALKSQEIAKTGTTSAKSTVGTVSEFVDETVGYQGDQEGSMGSAPVGIPEDQEVCEIYEGTTEEGEVCELQYEDLDETQGCGECEACKQDLSLNEAEYKGRKVKLGKKMAGDVKKYKVYVRKPNGNIVKVNFGDKKMRIKKSNPERRKSFRARHHCENPGPRWKARYWSCRNW